MNRLLVRTLLPLLGLGLGGTAIFLFTIVRPLPVEVARPADNVPVQVFGLGTVEARILSKIGFEVGAALVELNADHGDRVAAGTVLARIHSGEQEARVAKAHAGVRSGEAAVKRAQAAAGRARAVLSQKEQTNRRNQALLRKHTVSIELAEEAQMDRDVAAAELTVANRDVEVTQAALEDAQAQYRYEQVLLDHHTLIAPYDAIVVARHKELGSVLSSGDPLFTVVAPDSIWALAYVDEARAGMLHVDQPAQVRLRSLPGQIFRGHVSRIEIESDRVSEERRVYVACDQCPDDFHLGEQVEVLITIAVLDRALLIPEAAVERLDDTRGIVWTVEEGRLQRREVALGHRTLDARVEILEPLPAAGSHVVTGLRQGMREGRAARLIERASQ